MNAMKAAVQQDVVEGDEENSQRTSETTSIKGGQTETAATSSTGNRFHVEDRDILFGRGKGVNAHPGNQRMRRIIDKHRAEYHESERGEKCLLVRRVYDELTLGGAKFLKRVEGQEDEWEEVSLKAAVEKVGHSLRCAKYRPPPRSETPVCKSGKAQSARISVPQSILATNTGLSSPLIGSSQWRQQEHSIGPQHMVGITAPLTGGLMMAFPRERMSMPSFLPPNPLSSLDTYLAAELERSRLRSVLSLTPGSLSPPGTLNGVMSTNPLLAVMEQEHQIRRSRFGHRHHLSNQTAQLLSRYSIQK